MSQEDAEKPRLPEAGRVDRPMAAFWQLAKTWLRAPDRCNARWLVLLLVVLTVGQVLVQMRFNLWNRDFFNALENRDGAAFRTQILIFFGLAASAMAVERAAYRPEKKSAGQLVEIRGPPSSAPLSQAKPLSHWAMVSMQVRSSC